MNWERITVPGREDIVGIRTLETGERELLMHNEALCFPYYTAQLHKSTKYEQK